LITPRKNLRSNRRREKASSAKKSEKRFEAIDSMNFFWDLNDGEEGIYTPEMLNALYYYASGKFDL